MSILRGAFLAALFACLAVGSAMANGPGSNVRADGIVVVTHLDIIPQFAPLAFPLLVDFLEDTWPGGFLINMFRGQPTNNFYPVEDV